MLTFKDSGKNAGGTCLPQPSFLGAISILNYLISVSKPDFRPHDGECYNGLRGMLRCVK